MIHTQLYRRHYLITVFSILIFIFLGFIASNALIKLSFHHAPGPDPTFFARLIDDVNPHNRPRNRVEALQHIQQLNAGSLPFSFAIIDQNGKSLSNNPENLFPSWNSIQKPAQDYGFQPVEPDQSHFGPPKPPGPALIRFPGQPVQYLYVYFDGKALPSPLLMMLTTTASLILSILLGIGFALFLMFRTLHSKIDLADSVIAELQSGNLKARFPIQKMDEIGQAMSRFNKMADEIERLVEQLRAVEKSRMTLLQELAHDLRTPVASLKNLLATVSKKNETLIPELRAELIALSQKEVDYFERLVEDLLVLAQVSEPQYHPDRANVNLVELLDSEVEAVAAQFDTLNLQFNKSSRDGEIKIPGDLHLLRRLFRNALENACSFARSSVTISLNESQNASQVEIHIEDDGPGFSEEALRSFGERRISRVIQKSENGRLSIGLGSVIMKTVAQTHRGSIVASNRSSSSGKISGGRVAITLVRS